MGNSSSSSKGGGGSSSSVKLPEEKEKEEENKHSSNSREGSKKFHYNVHNPSDLLQPTSNSNSGAQSFLAAKSPLSHLLKDKLLRNGNGKEDMPDSKSHALSALLAAISKEEEGAKEGRIAEGVFKSKLLPQSKILADRFWSFLKTKGEGMSTLDAALLTREAEGVFALHTDKEQLGYALKVFAGNKDVLERSAFLDFLKAAFLLFGLKESGWIRRKEKEREESLSSLGENPYLEGVARSCYHIKEEMSLCFLTNWLLSNLPRLHLPVHNYLTHQLTTGYTQLSSPPVKEVVTQVQEEEEVGGVSKEEYEDEEEARMEPVLLWLLKASLPATFLAIFNKKKKPETNQLRPSNSTQLLMQLMQLNFMEPEESWTRLYESEKDGLSINRFQFHVFNYRGPSLLIIHAENGYSLALALDTEWRESPNFWGNENAVLVQLRPEFRVVERGPKLVYVNFSIRGYPFGIQVGRDLKNLSLEIKPDLALASFKKIPCRVIRIEVWGCAPKEAHAAQTEQKKWEARQCEKARKVDRAQAVGWEENPDKYLLELAGNYRSYNHSS